ncbi:hypothetical protein Y032_0305g1941 [Ancylostoma ceylanicum]|uniref:Saposin B-type domain-containing protein n=1 Tax=Ancylostoma ceylanicum TaxID=53326 RepID=A0A016S419_9BILA|nr:hypothetical protein Y032_0305g1941 [Ancylostoma ceylanicum]
MRAVCLATIFCLSYLVNANRDCRLECFNAALSYRNGKNENVANMEQYVKEECEGFAKNLYYPCSKAVPLILNNEEIKKIIEAWDTESASDKATEEAVKKYCWTACRKAN